MDREDKRFPFMHLITINSQYQKSFKANSDNLSLGGIFISTDKPLEKGTEGYLSLTIDTGTQRKDLNIRFIVSHNYPTDNGLTGMGMRFINLPQAYRDILIGVIANLGEVAA